MKAHAVFGSLLAIAGTAATAESANATVDIDIQEDLRQAVCFKDWYGAIEASSQLISSPKITPDYRQELLNWRRKFYAYAQAGAGAKGAISCENSQSAFSGLKLLDYQGPEPRFSNQEPANTPVASAVSVETPASFLKSLWAVGVRVEGNSIRGTVLNNGLTPANNVTLTIRSQKDDWSEDVQTVAIDTVRAWDEAEFVAAFSETPVNWMIERIEIN